MADNDRVDYTSGDVGHEQLAQTGRTDYTPGKSGITEDQSIFRDFRIPTGTPAFSGEAAGPVEMQRSRVVKLGRNIVSDQVIPTPTTEDTIVEAVTDNYISGTHTLTDKETIPEPSEVESTSGQDRVVGA